METGNAIREPAPNGLKIIPIAPLMPCNMFGKDREEVSSQRAPDLSTPIQALKNWQTSHPDPFAKRMVNHPRPDS